MDLASRELNSAADVAELLQALCALRKELKYSAIFGVFATPILAEAMNTASSAVFNGDWSNYSVSLYAAWNIRRSKDGEKPSFEHKQFSQVGELYLKY